MRCVAERRWARLWQGLASLIAGMLLCSMVQAQAVRLPALPLNDAEPVVEAQGAGRSWTDAQGTTSFEQVLRSRDTLFEPDNSDVIYSLRDRGAVWLHYRLLRGRSERNGWMLVFPMPGLDEVTVWQQDSLGQWLASTAGDMHAVSTWAGPGRYPYFRLELPPGQARDVYVRIRHHTSANFPVQLITEAAYSQRVQVEYMAVGLTFGALMLLITACLSRALVYRDSAYAWYSLYGSITALAVAAYTGVAAHLLWPGFGSQGDSPQGCLALLFAAAALLFARSLVGISARHLLLDRAVFCAGLAGIGLAALFPMLSKNVGLPMMSLYVALAPLTAMCIAFAAWRRGDEVGLWVLAAYLPLSLALLMTLLRVFGWLPVSFGTQYAVVVGITIKLPLLLVALNIRSRERHNAEIREQALSSQDALTGLLAPHLFHDRLRQVVARFRRDQESAAVVFIDLANYSRIKGAYGSAVAEQSLLRTVIKLRRVLRDVDTVSRIGEARFGLILEGVNSRAAVSDRSARLIAAGLMPLKGLKPDVTLYFHIAAVLLDERVMDGPELVDGLGALLEIMSPRTRRPIRFLAPEMTLPMPIDSDSSLHEPWPDSGLQPAAAVAS
ncbi:MAG TPA: 7TM diverse intracellular signaling domain-containing protein [Ramlibacter sp.]|nr:7TM diverse intracellular signaling domain-containing protein [Ramlibacter sp.]